MAFINKHVKFNTGLPSVPVHILNDPTEPCEVVRVKEGSFTSNLSQFQREWLESNKDIWFNDEWFIVANADPSLYVVKADSLHNSKYYNLYYVNPTAAAYHEDGQMNRDHSTITNLYSSQQRTIIIKSTSYNLPLTSSELTLQIPYRSEPITPVVEASANEPAINIYLESGV